MCYEYIGYNLVAPISKTVGDCNNHNDVIDAVDRILCMASQIKGETLG